MSDFKPQIPPIVRTVVYAVGLAWGTLATLVTGIAAVWWPDHAQAILATVGAGSSAVAFLAGGLGVAYRPTVPHAPDDLGGEFGV